MAKQLTMYQRIPETRRLIAIGDIHGHAVALAHLLDLIRPSEEDVIVTLGDYVNRGPDSRGVIDCLLELEGICRLVAIRGNHEEMMLQGRSDVNTLERWQNQGGWETLMSYSKDAVVEAVPDEHWRFLESCVPYFETDEFLFFHANYCWYLPPENQPGSLLRWTSINDAMPKLHISGRTAIVGHTPGPVRDFGFCRCIDTGCGLGGSLTAMDVNSGVCWSVLEEG